MTQECVLGYTKLFSIVVFFKLIEYKKTYPATKIINNPAGVCLLKKAKNKKIKETEKKMFDFFS